MKLRLSTLIPLAGLLMATGSSADTFVLKNGERLDAKIVKETPDSYVLDVKVTKSIRDEKTIPKADVAEIIPEKTDEIAFEGIKGLVPTPDLLPADEYTRRITAVSKFIKDNPKSQLVANAETILATLKSEQSAISAGGVKFDGKIVPAEEYAKDAYDLDAKVLEKWVKDAAARGDIVGALRGIDRLEKDFKMTASRRATTTLKTQLLRSYKARVDELMNTYDSRVEKRLTELNRMTGESRAIAERAQAEELETLNRLLAADKEKKERWSETHEFDKKSLELAQESIEEAVEETIDDAGKDAGKVYRNIFRLIGEHNDPDTLRDIVTKADEYDIPAKYTDRLKEAAKAKGASF